ncbi:hypothetical protein M2284_002527 [Rhodococcus sp. LBL1]|nr:hypothetical protein [Rhodococcus sp. LBL1]MDH6683911.1 hypothetical protein [Rhodococcus sp. LBL2]
MRRKVTAAILVALCWLAGAVVVRLGLDAVDRTPYSQTSETLYLVVAGVALLIAVGGSAAVIGYFVRTSRSHPRRRSRSAGRTDDTV